MRRVALFPILLASLSISAGCRRPDPAPSAPRQTDTPTVTGPSQPASAVRPSDTLGGPAAADAPDSALAHDSRPLLVCFGDSLTAGFGTEPGESYPDRLQRLLDSEGYRYRVVNLGISGNTTKDGVDRVARVVALHPALVVLEFGGNDGLRGLRLDDTRANLDRMLATLTAGAATKVAIAGITLPPDYGADYIQRFNSIYPDLARKYRVPYLPFLLQDVFGKQGMMQADNTHATAQGNEIVAHNVERLIRPLLRR